MRFKDNLKKLMNEQGLNQTRISQLTGLSNACISLYLAGEREPPPARKRAIAKALGLQEDYFDQLLPAPEIQAAGLNLPIPIAAKLLGKSAEWLYAGLQQGVFPWGYAVKMKDWSYFISAPKFSEATGIPLETFMRSEQ
jgi:transcriptional regulator with XRE-family HTH domain